MQTFPKTRQSESRSAAPSPASIALMPMGSVPAAAHPHPALPDQPSPTMNSLMPTGGVSAAAAYREPAP
jgi:hypothetical protein